MCIRLIITPIVLIGELNHHNTAFDECSLCYGWMNAMETNQYWRQEGSDRRRHLSWFIYGSQTMHSVTFSLHTGRITSQLKQALLPFIFTWLHKIQESMLSLLRIIPPPSRLSESDWPHLDRSWHVIKCHHVKLKDISWHLMTSWWKHSSGTDQELRRSPLCYLIWGLVVI